MADVDTPAVDDSGQQKPSTSSPTVSHSTASPVEEEQDVDVERANSSDEDEGPSLLAETKKRPAKLPGRPGTSVWAEAREVEPDEMLRYCDSMLEWLTTMEGTSHDEMTRIEGRYFKHWDKIITQPTNSEVEGKQEYFHPDWMEKQFRSYLEKAKRQISKMPTYACLDLMESALTSPIVCEMYPDFPKADIQMPRDMYIAAQYDKMKAKYPHMKYPDIQKALRAKYNDSTVLKLRYYEDFRQLLYIRRRLYGEFFDKHPELDPAYRPWWSNRIDRQLKYIERMEKRYRAAISFTPRPVFDFYRDTKAEKYSHLTGADLEAKLHRHFDKLSPEQREKYEAMAREWMLQNCPHNWREHYSLPPKKQILTTEGRNKINARLRRRYAEKQQRKRLIENVGKSADDGTAEVASKKPRTEISQ